MKTHVVDIKKSLIHFLYKVGKPKRMLFFIFIKFTFTELLSLNK